MKIYIDFDDVICETAKYFTKIAKELFDMISQYENPSADAKYFSLASYHLLMNFIDNSAFNCSYNELR